MTKCNAMPITQAILNAHKQVKSVAWDNVDIVYDEIRGNPYYTLKFCYHSNKLKYIEVYVYYRERPIMFITAEFIENFLTNTKNLSKKRKHKIIHWANERSANQKEIKKLIVLNLYNCGVL
ncbi:MAG: hypothetical protein Q4D02_02300 [Clostridia bacterium]|nr:hypothetical protein [Clostridia bacterium]